jgi:hypothetical protein
MRLDVILNTHDRSSAHPQARFIDAPKVEVTRRCVASLVDSLRASGVEHRLRILDDHSTDETVEILRGYGEVIPLEGTGYLQSIQGVLRLARASTADLVYMVEDDYLHCRSAVREAVDMHAQAQAMLGPAREVALKVYDDANDYDPRFAEESCMVFAGAGRHWKTSKNCCGTLLWTPRLMNHPLVRDMWDQISTMYMTKAGRLLNIHEGTTINRVWGHMGLLLSPMPSLAVHLADKEPPLFDWQTLWERHGPVTTGMARVEASHAFAWGST